MQVLSHILRTYLTGVLISQLIVHHLFHTPSPESATKCNPSAVLTNQFTVSVWIKRDEGDRSTNKVLTNYPAAGQKATGYFALEVVAGAMFLTLPPCVMAIRILSYRHHYAPSSPLSTTLNTG